MLLPQRPQYLWQSRQVSRAFASGLSGCCCAMSASSLPAKKSPAEQQACQDGLICDGAKPTSEV